ncbi:MAG TPA: carboxymuconolactone decarboxylase family protein [Actinomycetota bacterium]|nr:carboxymuconolactone decarboxylase family protein [Actinomycetota bacterium]
MDGRAFLEDMVRKRGYVQDFHRTLAEHDLEFLKAYEGLLDVSYLKQRRLSRLTKELIYIASLAVIGATRDHLRVHMRVAAQEGATSDDILEVLELVLPTSGVARFVEAVAVWREVFES